MLSDIRVSAPVLKSSSSSIDPPLKRVEVVPHLKSFKSLRYLCLKKFIPAIQSSSLEDLKSMQQFFHFQLNILEGLLGEDFDQDLVELFQRFVQILGILPSDFSIEKAKPQFEALHKMRENAASILLKTPKEKGEIYFDKQYGKTPLEQFLSFLDNFKKTPLEILENFNIKKDFVTPIFIKTFDNIENLDIKTTRLSFSGRAYKNLVRFPNNIKRFTNLWELTFEDCQFTELPLIICELKKLRILNIESNLFQTLPPELVQLQNLETLNLYDNKFTEFPLVICELNKLRTLIFSHNYLTTLPPKISQLTNLRTLDLTYNTKVSIFPPEIFSLTNLRKLKISNTRIKTLPPEFQILQNLYELYTTLSPLNLKPYKIMFDHMPHLKFFK